MAHHFLCVYTKFFHFLTSALTSFYVRRMGTKRLLNSGWTLDFPFYPHVEAAHKMWQNPNCISQIHVMRFSENEKSSPAGNSIAASQKWESIVHNGWKGAFFLLCVAKLKGVASQTLSSRTRHFPFDCCASAGLVLPQHKEIELWCLLENIIYSHAPQLQHTLVPWVQTFGVSFFTFYSRPAAAAACNSPPSEWHRLRCLLFIRLFAVRSQVHTQNMCRGGSLCVRQLRALAHWARGKLKIISRWWKAPGDYC